MTEFIEVVVGQTSVIEVMTPQSPVVIEVVAPGPQGIPGPPGTDPDLPSLSLIFENNLI